MDCNLKHSRRGFILGISVVMVVCAMIVATALLSYCSHLMSDARRCLLFDGSVRAAASVGEDILGQERWKFSEYLYKNITVGMGSSGLTYSPYALGCSYWNYSKGLDVYLGTITGNGPSGLVTLGDAADPTTLLTFQNGTNYMDRLIKVAINKSRLPRTDLRYDHQLQSIIVTAAAKRLTTGTYDEVPGTFTLMNMIRWNTTRAKVFNYAAFINGNMHLNNAYLYINGDVRANGNVYLQAAQMAGNIYAAANDRLQTAAVGKYYASKYSYNQATGTGAISKAPDTATYNSNNAGNSRARPVFQTDNASGVRIYPHGYHPQQTGKTSAITPNTSVTTPTSLTYGRVFEDYGRLPVPFCGWMGIYYTLGLEDATRNNAQNEIRYYVFNCNTMQPTSELRTDTYGYAPMPYNDNTFLANLTNKRSYFNTGPSGIVNGADRGVTVLVGTRDKPIQVTGSYVFPSDVIIFGYVSGQGTIYSCRNIYIPGNICYLNPPSWSHPDSALSLTANQNKDILGLVAKGCIVLGDPTSYYARYTLENIISKCVGTGYYCTEGDQAIGYAAKNALFSGKLCNEINAESSVSLAKYYDSQLVFKVQGTKYSSATTAGITLQPIDAPYSATARSVDTETVTCSQSGYSYLGPEKNSTLKTKAKVLLNRSVRFYDTLTSDLLLSRLAAEGNAIAFGASGAGAGVWQIDAALMANHGILGVGGCKAKSKGLTINGSMVARSEWIIFESGNTSKSYLNWDPRLDEDGPEGVSNLKVGLPEDPLSTRCYIWSMMGNSTWWNPNY